MDGEKMKVTKEDLQNVAVLSRLAIPADQEDKYILQIFFGNFHFLTIHRCLLLSCRNILQ